MHLQDDAKVVVAGSIAIDLSCDYDLSDVKQDGFEPQGGTSNPATIQQTVGGVGHNMTSALSYLGTPVRLCSMIADDLAGKTAKLSLVERGISTQGIEMILKGPSTAKYVAFNDAKKSLFMAMADMRILDQGDRNFENTWQKHLEQCKPRWLAIDANWNTSALRKWIHSAQASGAKVAFEPVSIEKSKRLFAKSDLPLGVIPRSSINIATPNASELASMFEAASTAGLFERADWFELVDSFGFSSSGSRQQLVFMTNRGLVDQGVPQQSIQLLPFIPSILTTLGSDGVLLTQALKVGDERLTSPDSAPYILSRSKNGGRIGGIYLRLFPPVERVSEASIKSVNGVGDTFLATIVAGLARENPKDLPYLVNIAQQCSVMSLKSTEAVSSDISDFRGLI